jgi:CheY-like chemotaxis protein
MAKILLVEDSNVQLKVVSKMLTDGGHEVKAVPSGLAALRLLTEGGIDLVVSDLYMPGLDGFELMQALRSGSNSIPIIVMSSNALACDVFRDAHAFGAAASLNKPFNADTLLSAVQAVLGAVPVAK